MRLCYTTVALLLIDVDAKVRRLRNDGQHKLQVLENHLKDEQADDALPPVVVVTAKADKEWIVEDVPIDYNGM